MRRLVSGFVLGGVLLSGCDKFAARSDVAALVGAHELSAARVAEIMGKSGGGPTLQAAEFIANLWLDYSLFAQAVAKNEIKTDSTSIEAVLWPTYASARARIWRDSVRARRAVLSAGAVDSAYSGTEGRIVQHIILMPAGPTAADTATAKKQADDALGKLRGGADFGQLAAQISGDGSKTDQGYLPFGPRGQFVKEFDDVAWNLQPGEMSGVVKSQFGFHIIRRPTLDEARSRIQAKLTEETAGKTDSLYIAELTAAYGIKVAGGGPAAMKSAAAYPEDVRKSNRTLVSIKGGDLTVGDFVKWTAMFPLQAKMQIRNAPDSLLNEFAKDLAVRTILVKAADSAGLQVQPQMRQFAQMRYTQSVEQLRTELGLGVPELGAESKLSAADKSKVASDKVEEFFARLLDGKAQMQVVLPELGDHLRATGGGKVNQAGVARAVELATAQFRRDSAAAAAKGGQPGAPAPIQQAPGGPPIGEPAKP